MELTGSQLYILYIKEEKNLCTFRYKFVFFIFVGWKSFHWGTGTQPHSQVFHVSKVQMLVHFIQVYIWFDLCFCSGFSYPSPYWIELTFCLNNISLAHLRFYSPSMLHSFRQHTLDSFSLNSQIDRREFCVALLQQWHSTATLTIHKDEPMKHAWRAFSRWCVIVWNIIEHF